MPASDDSYVDPGWMFHGYKLAKIEDMPPEYQVEMDLFEIHPEARLLTRRTISNHKEFRLYSITSPSCLADITYHNNTFFCGCIQRWNDWNEWRPLLPGYI